MSWISGLICFARGEDAVAKVCDIDSAGPDSPAQASPVHGDSVKVKVSCG